MISRPVPVQLTTGGRLNSCSIWYIVVTGAGPNSKHFSKCWYTSC